MAETAATLFLDSLTVGPLAVNCYLVGDAHTRQVAIIDPGDDAADILALVKHHGLTVTAIINTHAHCDHLGALPQVKAQTSAPFLLHRAELPLLNTAHLQALALMGRRLPALPGPDRFLQDGDTIPIGQQTLTVIHTPGHSPGGISLLVNSMVFTGDTLFAGGIGRTDFPGGDYDTLIASIRNRLLSLPDETVVYSGHGPVTTIGNERRYNPFL